MNLRWNPWALPLESSVGQFNKLRAVAVRYGAHTAPCEVTTIVGICFRHRNDCLVPVLTLHVSNLSGSSLPN